MNPRDRKKIATVLVFIALFSTVTLAFGYMKGGETASVEAGGTSTFQFHVFGDNGSVEVQEIEQPAGWQVDVTPGLIELPPEEEDFRYRQTSDGYQKIAPIRVEIDVPIDAQGGSHTVVVNMQQRGEEATGYLNVQQVQDFDFTVQVDGAESPTEISAGEENTTEGTTENVGNTTETAVDANQSSEEETQSPSGRNATAQEAEERDGLPWTTIGIIVFEILWVIAVIYLVRERYF